MKLQQDCSASKARSVYKFRPYKNFALGLGVFIVICLPLLLFLNAWIAGVIAILPAFGLYYFLESRVLIIQCPNCGKDIDTNTPWLCGFKACRNENVDHQHPFIHECQHCHYPPKAYECHHCDCGEPIFLTTDRQKIHMAKFLVGRERVKAKPKDAIAEKIASQTEKIRDKEHKLKLTVLDKKIKIEKNKPDAPVTTSTKDKMRKLLKEGMSVHQAAKELKAEADVEFADDPHELGQAHGLINQLAMELMPPSDEQ